MIDWKKLIKKLLFPPAWLIALLAVVSAAALTAVFLMEMDSSPIAYFVYVLSFYSLTVACVFSSVVLPKHLKSAKSKIYNTKYGNRYMTDAVFRTNISLYISLSINLLYVIVNLISGYLYGSVWFFILAVYYTVLSVMRFLLVRYESKVGIGKDVIKEYRQSRICAVILLTVNLSLSGAVLMMMYQNKGFEYQGMLIYIMAMYTFYMTVHTAINLVKYRKYNSPVLSTAKAISFTAALISMLSLETAMLTAFGNETPAETKRTLIAATGAGISIILITMSVYMIRKANKEIPKLQKEKDYGKQ